MVVARSSAEAQNNENPLLQAERQHKLMEQLLADAKQACPVHSFVYFANKNARVGVRDARIYTDETGTAYNATVTYYDGLYRQEQTVQVGASPAGGDIVSFVEYDCMGRADSVSYLPFVTATASGAKSPTR